jgi:hypothetical protein
MEVNGMAHVILTASNFERSRDFYRKLLPFLGLQPMIDSDEIYYCVGGRTALGIRKPAAEHAGAVFEQSRVGLHHLCFPVFARCEDHPRAARGSMGTGILFGTVRGSGWNEARAQPCSGEGTFGVSEA